MGGILHHLAHETLTTSPSPFHTTLFFLSLLTLTWLAHDLYTWRVHLRHVPGPFRSSLTCYHALFTRGFSGRLNSWITSQNDQHGRLFRIGPNHVITDDPDVLRRLGTQRSSYSKSGWYTNITRLVRGADSTLSLGGSARNNALHRERRGLLAGTYAGRDNSSSTSSSSSDDIGTGIGTGNSSSSAEQALDLQVGEFVAYLDRKSTNETTNTVVDFSVAAQYFALDAIAQILWGSPFGFLRDDADFGRYVQTLQDFLPVRSALSSLPILSWLRPVLERMLPSSGDEFGLGRLMGAAERAIRDRLGDSGVGGVTVKGVVEGKKVGRGDMLSGLMEKGLSGEELFSETVMAIVAGSDNTASALRMAVALLVVTPAAYRKLCEEIDEGVAAGRVSEPVVTDGEARAMPYLQAVVRETLRLYPLPAELYKEVPPEGDEVAGYFLPGGTRLGMNLHGVGRRRDLWGEDAAMFRPERWTEAAADERDGGERFRNMVGWVDLTFGSGRFQCLGKPLALMELNKVIVALLRNFDFAAVDPARPVDVGGYLMYLIKGQVLRVTRRDH